MNKILLASGSPRRRQILEESGFEFEHCSLDVDESFSSDMPVNEVASYLALKKMTEALKLHSEKTVIITADTVVILDDEIIGKPEDEEEAIEMLSKLSGKEHLVHTAVVISNGIESHLVESETVVTFLTMTKSEIEFYIHHYQPYDKAGSYAIQEWIGMNKIASINGDYYNVVGFPMSKVYPVLVSLLNK